MARVKLSEYTIKKLLYADFGKKYTGVHVDSSKPLAPQLETLAGRGPFVVKVDQGVKKRYKNGLLFLQVEFDQLIEKIELLSEKGFHLFIIEDYQQYSSNEERYFSVERGRDGYLIIASARGGVSIEDNKDSLMQFTFPYGQDQQAIRAFVAVQDVRNEFSFAQWLHQLLTFFDTHYLSFLEINPLLILDGFPCFLDAACEIDDAGLFFVADSITNEDIVSSDLHTTCDEIESVKVLAEGSQASLKLDLLNPDGSLFLLLSGGGASIVLADQIYDLGYGREIANYGEYSGNPNEEETYTYSKNVFSLLLKSPAPRKAVVIAGGVANFTDIRKTFDGIIRAIKEVSPELQRENVKFFVRRGGPFQKQGLAKMRTFLEKENLLGVVSGPEMVLTEIAEKAVQYVLEKK